jgi:hypothetical protein
MKMNIFKKQALYAAAIVAMLSVAGFSATSSMAKDKSTHSTQASSSTSPIAPAEAPASMLSARNKSCSAIARVTSQPMPLPGQTHRSSGNFSLDSIRVGQVFRVVVKKGVSFNLKRDIRYRVDPTLASGMKAGYYKRVSSYPLYPVYIADPRGAGKSAFTVTFCR